MLKYILCNEIQFRTNLHLQPNTARDLNGTGFESWANLQTYERAWDEGG